MFQLTSSPNTMWTLTVSQSNSTAKPNAQIYQVFYKSHDSHVKWQGPKSGLTYHHHRNHTLSLYHTKSDSFAWWIVTCGFLNKPFSIFSCVRMRQTILSDASQGVDLNVRFLRLLHFTSISRNSADWVTFIFLVRKSLLPYFIQTALSGHQHLCNFGLALGIPPDKNKPISFS